jgi:S1-C subfamily serine protease
MISNSDNGRSEIAMKTSYQVSAKQMVVLALVTALFTATAVVLYDRFGSELVGRIVGAKPGGAAIETGTVDGLTDPSVATDEKNNQEVYRALSPGVVNITSTVYVQSWFDVYPKQGSGSGSILDKEGHILTNYHVIQGAEKLEVTLSNEHNYQARPLAGDPDNDLAVIKIDAPASELTPIPLGNSKEVFIGQKVLAIGNPFGFQRTLTTGIVSGLSRPIRSEITNRLIEGVIQTDAAINMGNSGGPLLNSRGQMIGINTLIISPSGGSVGIGFAVPVDTAKRVVNDILQYGRVRKPRLGITPYPVTPALARALNLPVKEGTLIVGIVPGGPAAKAGLRGPTDEIEVRGGGYFPIGGDIIVGIDGQPVKSQDDLDRVLNNKNVGDRVQVEAMRDGRRITLPVQLAEVSVPSQRRN